MLQDAKEQAGFAEPARGVLQIESEAHWTGTIQHVTTDNLLLASLLYEAADKAGHGPEFTEAGNGSCIDFYASEGEMNDLLAELPSGAPWR